MSQSTLPVLEDLLARLLSEGELRRLFGRLGLTSLLPGAGVTLAELAHAAAALTERRAVVDELLEALREEVGRIAGGLRPAPILAG